MVQSSPHLRSAIVLTLALSGLGVGGCNQTGRQEHSAIQQYEMGDYAGAAATLKPKTEKRDENYVLNNCRFGSCAIAAGDRNGAEQAFMNVYQVMNSTKVNDAGRQAGAAVVFEGVKVWTGEPFERAMAHYYLALSFLLKGDYENARAAFQNSLFKIREYANKDKLEQFKQVDSTFALGYFGLGYCYLRMGNTQTAEANFALAQKYQPGLANLITQVKQPWVNTLIFVDAGYGPRKAGKGWYNEESAFYPTPAEVGAMAPAAIAIADGKQISGAPGLVDTLQLAQERKWQDIDTIKKTKAVLGTGMMAAGTGMAAYGASSKNNEPLMWAGIGTALAGAALAASSQSDVRCWEMLPRTVYIIPATLQPGEHDVSVTLVGGVQSGTVHATIRPQRPNTDNIFYFRIGGADNYQTFEQRANH